MLAVVLLALLSPCRLSAKADAGAGTLALGPEAPDTLLFVPALGPAAAADAEAAPVESDGEGGPYFYQGYEYGGQAYAGPLDVVLNKGFALVQVMNRSQRVFGYDYGWEGLFDALAHPLRAV